VKQRPGNLESYSRFPCASRQGEQYSLFAIGYRLDCIIYRRVLLVPWLPSPAFIVERYFAKPLSPWIGIIESHAL